MIIVTDAHVSEAYDNVGEFFQMLEGLAATCEDIVFLGDIFELWIGLNRYEEAIHREFISWCSTQKQKRNIGFIEGNHEFYVAQRHEECFTWSSTEQLADPKRKLLLVHGDLINKADKNYLNFRRLTKNPFAKAFVSMLPNGPAIAEELKAKLKKTNKVFRLGLPKDALNAFAEAQFAAGMDRIIVGHFHEDYTYKNDREQMLRVLPDWFTHRCIAHVTTTEITVKPWQDV